MKDVVMSAKQRDELEKLNTYMEGISAKHLKIPVKRLGKGYYCYAMTDKYKSTIKFNASKHVEVCSVKVTND